MLLRWSKFNGVYAGPQHAKGSLESRDRRNMGASTELRNSWRPASASAAFFSSEMWPASMPQR